MSRYFTRAAVIGTPDPIDSEYMLDCRHDQRSITLHENELETFTGLYNASGEPIHRTERIAMGFGRK